MNDSLLIVWLADDQEHEEMWSSVAAFEAWALTENVCCDYRVFSEDEDGEWVLTSKGRITTTAH